MGEDKFYGYSSIIWPKQRYPPKNQVIWAQMRYTCSILELYSRLIIGRILLAQIHRLKFQVGRVIESSVNGTKTYVRVYPIISAVHLWFLDAVLFLNSVLNECSIVGCLSEVAFSSSSLGSNILVDRNDIQW